jgi:hypothetical protein
MSTDTTPDPREMTRAPDPPEFVQPEEDLMPAHEAREVRRGDASAGEPDIARRPPLPEHAPPSAADLEDEEADPVGTDQPTLAERLQSDSELQRG